MLQKLVHYRVVYDTKKLCQRSVSVILFVLRPFKSKFSLSFSSSETGIQANKLLTSNETN